MEGNTGAGFEQRKRNHGANGSVETPLSLSYVQTGAYRSYGISYNGKERQLFPWCLNIF